MNDNRVSIVTPSYEKHALQYDMMVSSIKKHCSDFDILDFIVIVENKNTDKFVRIFDKNKISNYTIISTEDILKEFSCNENVSDFISRVGKFTFQTVKKFGGLLASKNSWSIVLDSEGIFCKDFSAQEIVKDYSDRKYIFYTETKPRENLWENSLGHQINKNTSEVLQFDATKRWYMEYFHWFYETTKAHELIKNHLSGIFLEYIQNKNHNYDYNHFKYEGRSVDFFENILYYSFLEKYYSDEYKFLNFKEIISEFVPEKISGRFKLDELPFSLFGNDYLLNIVSPEDIIYLKDLFDEYKLPFIRLEPPFFTPKYFEKLKEIPSFIATISSHHHIWMNKKIAICISGEFRHVLHRTPEQQIRALKGFLSGVDCDIYVHGWHNTSEALIINELNPRRFKFEERISFLSLERKIKFREPRLKPGRDQGSLSMFYSLQESYKLLEEDNENYDYIVRIRPDIFPDFSLKEILVQISDGGDYIENSIYFPKLYHSKGINDQFAIGNVSSMSVYFKTFEYIKENIEKLFFNPESILLKNLLVNSILPCMVDFPYALMRHLPFRVHDINRVMREQEHVWWSRTDSLPTLVDLSAYFHDKLRSMEDSMNGEVPNVLFFPFKHEKFPNGTVFIETKNDDNNPSKGIAAYFYSDGILNTSHCVINSDYVEFAKDFHKHTFVYVENDSYVFSQWRFVENKFSNFRHIFSKNKINNNPALSVQSMIDAWKTYDEIQQREYNGDVVYRNIDNDEPRKLNFNRYLFIMIFSIFIKKKMKSKIHTDPDLFFNDSKNAFTKKIGEIYKNL